MIRRPPHPDPAHPDPEDPGSPPGPYDAGAPDEADLWFLPDPDDAPDPAEPPLPRADRRALADVGAWRRAEAGRAAALARVAGRFGALDDRLRHGPPGQRQRLALIEAADLSWLAGDRIAADQLALWQAMHLAGVQQEPQAMARAGWAFRRLSGGPGPEAGLAAFLARHEVTPPLHDGGGGGARAILAEAEAGRLSDEIAAWAEAMAEADDLHPITRAALAFHLWSLAGMSGPAVAVEAGVLAARLAASEAVGGALFLPLALGGDARLGGGGGDGGDPGARLDRWYAAADQATRRALAHLDRLAAWQTRAGAALARYSGRTPARLISVLADWPLVSAPMAEAATGASRAAVQRNLARIEADGLIREVTGQSRYRTWTAFL